MTTTDYLFGDYNVSLASEAEASLGKLDELHICHLGMKFISDRKIPEFNVYEFEIAVKPLGTATDALKVKCCGVVVSSEPEGGRFRTVIHFSDLAPSDANCLEAVTRDKKMRCEYCGNC
ncbi:MAG TPA: hypothetical protein PL039_09285 [Kiritimatiellia bacterium]|jgi:hypothetical protein|nr:hypothetical protein [Lentisphaerota bacterium]HPC20376.1 hypothetical protein [Kiritimatiellia bacterium]